MYLSLERVREFLDLRLLLGVHGGVRAHLLVPEARRRGPSQLEVFRLVLSHAPELALRSRETIHEIESAREKERERERGEGGVDGGKEMGCGSIGIHGGGGSYSRTPDGACERRKGIPPHASHKWELA